MVGPTLWVQLPTGRVRLTVGGQVRTIPAAQVASGEAIEADGDRAFVPIRVEYRDLEGTPATAPQDPAVDPAELTRVSLVIGGASYPVPFSAADELSYLEVEQSSDDGLSLEVEFDGVPQSVDESGRRDEGESAGLYDASTRLELLSCGEETEDRPEGAGAAPVRTCRYDLWQYPYLEGLGWASQAEPGAIWAVATAQTWLRADQVRGQGGGCRPGAMGGSARLSLDGQQAIEELPVVANQRAGGHGLGARAAFLVTPSPEHDLEIVSTWGCRLGDRSQDQAFVDRVSARP
ncbi:hypothetical protein JK386_07035 [Nocardioides sp. zg-536]|uniref:Uncharacterized protein n=1 Tax=Nocardioides faecalis TaxID=2803858 RepID=A0A938Y5L5_9ACTN|nr:hypothetical protein [Nocardioides faecalis]MBM9459652.1 hypothetical protein [Nocardioides faecalis]QVI58174.1 hypothetical protein KG111_14330 [Nocardioides faecalis]